jgi:ABC-type sugar transport system substrate-binding protein
MNPWVLVSLGYGRHLMESTEYQRRQELGARLAAERGGLGARILVAEGDADLQMQQILEAVAAPPGSRPAGVVACTVGEAGFDRVARTVLEAGVGWVLVDNEGPLTSLRAEFPDRLVSWASVDYVELGRISARMALVLLPGGGKILCMEGPSAAAAALRRRQGLNQVLHGSNVQIVETLVADWKPAGAAKATEAWLERARTGAVKPDLIVSQNDEMAEGVLRTLRASRPEWGRIPAIGCDGLPDGGQRLVREGDLVATILNPAPFGPGVDLVVRWLRGEQVEPVTIPARPYPAIEELAPLGSAV